MTNKQLQEILKNYPDECEISIESISNYNECEIVQITVEYIETNDFTLPNLILEYRNKENY